VAKAPKDWRHPQFNLAFARVARAPAKSAARTGSRPHRPDRRARHGRTEKPTRLPPSASTSDAAPRCGTRATASYGRTMWRSSKDRERSTRACPAGTRIIAYEPASGGYRLRDDGSVHGTSVVRNGSTVAVPPGRLEFACDGGRARAGRSAAPNQVRRRPSSPAPETGLRFRKHAARTVVGGACIFRKAGRTPTSEPLRAGHSGSCSSFASG
jgi:hypothetical protein